MAIAAYGFWCGVFDVSALYVGTEVIDQHSFSIECAKKGTCQKLKEHWKSWYSADDFQLMKK